MQHGQAIRTLQATQFSVFHVITSDAIPLHAHPEYVLGFYFRGVSRCRFSPQSDLIFGPGDLGLINPGSVHEDFASPRERDYLSISLQGDLFRELLGSMGSDARTLPCFPESKIGKNMEVANVCRAICRELDRPDLGSEIVIQGLVTQLAVALLRRHPGCRIDPEQADPDPRGSVAQIRQVADYLRENCSEEFNLDNLSKLAGLSKFHLERVFKRATGLNPHAFMMVARLDKARYLLSHSEKPITDIALSLGFSDQSHFTNVFKRFNGVTPNRYRNETK